MVPLKMRRRGVLVVQAALRRHMASASLAMQTAAFVKAHPGKDGRGERGEDAFFATSLLHKGAAQRFEGIGVADGVADWSVKGVDSGALRTAARRAAYSQAAAAAFLFRPAPPSPAQSRHAHPLFLPSARGRHLAWPNMCFVAFDPHAHPRPRRPSLRLARARALVSDVMAHAGVYSRSLMAEAAQRVVALSLDGGDAALGDTPDASPSRHALDKAYALVTDDGTRGSCTATVAVLDGESAALSTLSLGDSGVVVLRDGAVVYQSEAQQHEFGRPFQLSSDVCDTPADGIAARIDAEEGDLVVVATDGLWDNIDVEFLCSTLWSVHSDERLKGRSVSYSAAETMAVLTVNAAYAASIDRMSDTPFARRYRDEQNLIYNGGKLDDIAVAIGVIERAAPSKKVDALRDVDDGLPNYSNV